jgi:hypothetical protein
MVNGKGVVPVEAVKRNLTGMKGIKGIKFWFNLQPSTFNVQRGEAV